MSDNQPRRCAGCGYIHRPPFCRRIVVTVKKREDPDHRDWETVEVSA